MGTKPNSYEYTLKDQDYLDLWKYYSEDTAKIKDKLWTIASWLYALMSGLMGFIAKYQIELEDQVETAIGKHLSFWSIAMAMAGFVLSLYTAYMIREYGWHIKGGWRITDSLIDKIGGLKEVWESRKKRKSTKKEEKKWWDKIINLPYRKEEKEEFPPFAKRLEIFAWGYGIGFLSVLVYILIKTI